MRAPLFLQQLLLVSLPCWLLDRKVRSSAFVSFEFLRDDWCAHANKEVETMHITLLNGRTVLFFLC